MAEDLKNDQKLLKKLPELFRKNLRSQKNPTIE